jgi:outer membrane autotransporter protein
VVVSGGGDVTVDSSGASVVVNGGRGGDGGNGNSTGNQAHGGDGGAGGAGIEAAGGGNVTVDNGTIQGGDGGAGGNGGSSAAAGNGGAGGAGIDAAGATSVTVGTDGTVTGGAGGAGGTTSTPGSAGAGGVGIIASGGITVTVAGSVSGGMSGDTSPVQADAIDLTGGGNTLKLEDGFSFTGNVVSDGTGAGDTLELGGDTDSGFDLSGLGSAFTDFAALDKTGTSTWTLTNSSDFSGPTTVSDGTLALDAASLANSAVTVDTDGTLSASGASAVKSVDVSGAVTLSTATTTLTAAGGATFETDSTFNVTVDSSGNASKIDSGIGAAIIDGGEVMVTAGTGAYSPTTQYVIVTGQSVSDTFDGAEMAAGSPFLTPSLHYDVTDEVYLTFATDFGSAANTYNQQQVAGALDAWGLGGPLSAYLLNLDDDTAPAAYDTLSGDVYASIKTALLDDSHIVRDAMEDRLLASSDNGKNVWGKVFGNWDSYDGNGNAAGFSNQTTGVLFGADGILGDWRLGGLIGYGRGAFSVPDRSSSADVDGYHVGLYAGTGTGSLQFRAGAGFTSHQIAMSRDVAFGDFSDSLSGDYTADVAQGFAELGYTLDMGGASIQPFANLAGVALHTDGFAENGGDAALTVAAGDEDVTLTTLGFHASAGLGTFATANATVGWQHAFGATPHSDVAFESGDAFDVAGVPLAADAAIVKAALDLALAPAATLSLIYGGQFATGAIDQSANADLSVKF